MPWRTEVDELGWRWDAVKSDGLSVGFMSLRNRSLEKEGGQEELAREAGHGGDGLITMCQALCTHYFTCFS